ncbi:hypothetical protein Taro_013796 [Colocasia esculenta]|uniref:Uncharacterized protein n=1 Tax=Colocasia esculenta TaxID=4460 RepID=A0A843U7D5_COLES|nr:hypothetical protein [Colocasia esculenta]
MGSRDQAPRTGADQKDLCYMVFVVYPRVKVGEQVDPKSFQVTTDLLLKVAESLSREGGHPSNVPASKQGNSKSYSSSQHSAISSPCLSNLSSPSVFNGSEGRKKEGLDQDKKHNVRASSVPRPRAVLSSPDNDDMIGHQNRLLREREREKETPLRVQTSRGSGAAAAAAQRKPTPKNIGVQSPVSRRETTKVPSNSNSPKKKSSPIHAKTLRQTPAKGKSNPDWVF